MDSLDMEARIAQMMMVPLYSRPGEPESAMESVTALIVDLGVGGVIAMQGTRPTRPEPSSPRQPRLATSGVGLLTAMDAEWASGMRLPDGIRFPKAMALGAIEDVDLIRQAGRVAGYELRALGVDMDFAPVVDVNSNPDNPVIGNRSFGSDPVAVGERGLACRRACAQPGSWPARSISPATATPTSTPTSPCRASCPTAARSPRWNSRPSGTSSTAVWKVS